MLKRASLEKLVVGRELNPFGTFTCRDLSFPLIIRTRSGIDESNRVRFVS